MVVYNLCIPQTTLHENKERIFCLFFVRILKCFIQARSSLRVPLSLYCWNEVCVTETRSAYGVCVWWWWRRFCLQQAAVCDCVRAVQEVTVAGTGHFKALSDGTVEVLFLDGVRAQMMWKSDTCTPAQVHKHTGGISLVQLHTDHESSHQTACLPPNLISLSPETIF